MAVPFDPQRLAVTARRSPLSKGVLQVAGSERPVQLFSRDRWSMFRAAFRRPKRKLVWVNRKGAEQPLAAPAHTLPARGFLLTAGV